MDKKRTKWRRLKDVAIGGTKPLQENPVVSEGRENTIEEIKKFVGWRDRSGNLEYTFGQAFGMPEEKINTIGGKVMVQIARIRYRYMNNQIGSIGIAIRILEDVLGLEEYSPNSMLRSPGYTAEQVMSLALTLQSLDRFAQERLVQNFAQLQKIEAKKAMEMADKTPASQEEKNPAEVESA